MSISTASNSVLNYFVETWKNVVTSPLSYLDTAVSRVQNSVNLVLDNGKRFVGAFDPRREEYREQRIQTMIKAAFWWTVWSALSVAWGTLALVSTDWMGALGWSFATKNFRERVGNIYNEFNKKMLLWSIKA